MTLEIFREDAYAKTGEATVVGNQDSRYSLWGHIKGPGPNDLIVFPRDATMWRIENAVIPDASPPTITMLSDTGGAAPIEQNTYTRTEETLTIIGSEMASVTAIEIMRGNLVLHTIMPVVDEYEWTLGLNACLPAVCATSCEHSSLFILSLTNRVDSSCLRLCCAKSTTR